MLISLCLPIVLFTISLSDIRNRIISNWLILVVFFISLVSYLSGDIEFYFPSLIISFLVGFVFWILKVIGAGDVKLSSALSLMIDPNYLFLSVFIMAVVGAILAAVEILLNKLIDQRERRALPYGVAISIGFGVGIFASI